MAALSNETTSGINGESKIGAICFVKFLKVFVERSFVAVRWLVGLAGIDVQNFLQQQRWSSY